jgi:hypothetical protein
MSAATTMYVVAPHTHQRMHCDAIGTLGLTAMMPTRSFYAGMGGSGTHSQLSCTCPADL